MKRPRISNWLILICLLAGGTLRSQSTWGDYTLYATQNGTKAYLINMSGATYHTWTFASSARTAYSTYMLPGGTLVRTVSYSGNVLWGGGMTGRVQKVDWNGNVLWDYTHSTSTYCLHHDICPMPNGNVLMIAYEVKTSSQAQQAGCSSAITIWSEKIIEVQPTGATTGNIVWEWHFWDHLCQNVNPSLPNYVSSIVQHPELLNINYNPQKDWIHANGIDYNAELDQIVVSSHMLNEFYVIDHSTTTAEAAGHTGGNSGRGGDFLYRWGNPPAYQASGTKIFNVVHDAHWVPNNCPKAGYFSAFNNKGGTNNKTCIDLVNPPYNGYNYSITPGQAYTPASYNWRHTYSGTATQDLGNAQQLPNGNTLICIAMSGYIYEIDSNQTVVWSKTISGSSAHAYRYTAAYTNGLSATASSTPPSVCLGDTIQLNVVPTGGTSYTYSWSSNQGGFSSSLQNPVLVPAISTTYYVTVYNGTDSVITTVTVPVYPLPAAPVITANGNTLSSSTGFAYQWFFNGVAVNGATGQSLSPTQDGDYQVQVTSQNGCLSDLSAPFNFVYSGLDEWNKEQLLSVYPNPANDYLNLEGQMTRQPHFEVSLYDLVGNRVIHLANEKVINIGSLRNGIYFLTVKTGESGPVSRRICVTK